MGSIEKVMGEAEQQEDEELEEGPPPGFYCIQSSQLPQKKQESMDQEGDDVDDDDDDDDEVKGPPPGFSTPLALTSDACMEAKEDVMDEDGPPPGWCSLFTEEPETPPKTPLVTTVSPDVKQQNNQEDIEDEDDGPPPGWELIPPQLPKPPSTSASSPLSTVPSDIGMAEMDTTNNSKIPPPRSGSTPVKKPSSSPCPLMPPQSSTAATSETGNGHGGTKYVINDGRQLQWQSVPSSKPPQSNQLPPPPRAAPSDFAVGQLVCGTCRRLNSYPRGAKYVKCGICQEVNFVLEEHEVGQVKCGGCSLLLMYQYGSPAVSCSSCRHVTTIGAHNGRPPLSEQQARRRSRCRRVR